MDKFDLFKHAFEVVTNLKKKNDEQYSKKKNGPIIKNSNEQFKSNKATANTERAHNATNQQSNNVNKSNDIINTKSSQATMFFDKSDIKQRGRNRWNKYDRNNEQSNEHRNYREDKGRYKYSQPKNYESASTEKEGNNATTGSHYYRQRAQRNNQSERRNTSIQSIQENDKNVYSIARSEYRHSEGIVRKSSEHISGNIESKYNDIRALHDSKYAPREKHHGATTGQQLYYNNKSQHYAKGKPGENSTWRHNSGSPGRNQYDRGSADGNQLQQQYNGGFTSRNQSQQHNRGSTNKNKYNYKYAREEGMLQKGYRAEGGRSGELQHHGSSFTGERNVSDSRAGRYNEPKKKETNTGYVATDHSSIRSPLKSIQRIDRTIQRSDQSGEQGSNRYIQERISSRNVRGDWRSTTYSDYKWKHRTGRSIQGGNDVAKGENKGKNARNNGVYRFHKQTEKWKPGQGQGVSTIKQTKTYYNHKSQVQHRHNNRWKFKQSDHKFKYNSTHSDNEWVLNKNKAYHARLQRISRYHSLRALKRINRFKKRVELKKQQLQESKQLRMSYRKYLANNGLSYIKTRMSRRNEYALTAVLYPLGGIRIKTSLRHGGCRRRKRLYDRRAY